MNFHDIINFRIFFPFAHIFYLQLDKYTAALPINGPDLFDVQATVFSFKLKL